jgi:hypothetical protein
MYKDWITPIDSPPSTVVIAVNNIPVFASTPCLGYSKKASCNTLTTKHDIAPPTAQPATLIHSQRFSQVALPGKLARWIRPTANPVIAPPRRPIALNMTSSHNPVFRLANAKGTPARKKKKMTPARTDRAHTTMKRYFEW